MVCGMSVARQQPGVTRDLSKCLSQMGVGCRQLGALAGGGESGSGVEPRGQCGPGDELEEGAADSPPGCFKNCRAQRLQGAGEALAGGQGPGSGHHPPPLAPLLKLGSDPPCLLPLLELTDESASDGLAAVLARRAALAPRGRSGAGLDRGSARTCHPLRGAAPALRLLLHDRTCGLERPIERVSGGTLHGPQRTVDCRLQLPRDPAQPKSLLSPRGREDKASSQRRGLVVGEAGRGAHLSEASGCGPGAQLLRRMWNLSKKEIKPTLPALAGRLPTTRKSSKELFKKNAQALPVPSST